MKLVKRNLLAVGGVIGAVLGLTLAIPALMKNQYGAASISGILIVGGIILLAIALGDEDEIRWS